mmetsp:Transcript_32994/g.76017  ORF Transcript_32994/g.76017 Transcript_32994/m.76017 type:complete len:315 (-) Transcript_32994:49-993(-)
MVYRRSSTGQKNHLSELIERIEAMRAQEISFETCNKTTRVQKQRDKICGWYFDLADNYNLDRSIVSTSISFLDRYLSKSFFSDRHVALASLTCLFIAIKICEPRKVIKISTFSHLSRDLYSQKDIVEMEIKILKSLEWRLHLPTSIDFLNHFLELLPFNTSPKYKEDLRSMAHYLTELSLFEQSFPSYKPSSIAFSSLIVALERSPKNYIRREEYSIFMDSLISIVDDSASPHFLKASSLMHDVYKKASARLCDDNENRKKRLCNHRAHARIAWMREESLGTLFDPPEPNSTRLFHSNSDAKRQRHVYVSSNII